jgi:hypothetical protein
MRALLSEQPWIRPGKRKHLELIPTSLKTPERDERRSLLKKETAASSAWVYVERTKPEEKGSKDRASCPLLTKLRDGLEFERVLGVE